MALERTESPAGARNGRGRPAASYTDAEARERHYGRKTMETAKALGISVWEASCWNVEFRHDEVVEYHRKPASLYPEGIRWLAFAMLHQVRRDLSDEVLRSWRMEASAKDYRPDPVSAREWVERASDKPLQFRWCCQVLRVPEDRVRGWVLGGRPCP